MTLTNDQIKQRFGEALITKKIRSATDAQIVSFVVNLLQNVTADQAAVFANAIRKSDPKNVGKIVLQGIRVKVKPIVDADIDAKLADDTLTREEFSDLVE